MTTARGRFARHELVPGWSQALLAQATIVIVGVGALGNAAAQTLALAGVGRLVLCDPDVVTEANLSRAPLFRAADVDRLKVDAAADALRALSPALVIDRRAEPLVSGVGLAELRDASLVLGCLDSRAARLQLAGRCGLTRARWIDGATACWSGEIRPYLDPDGPCYGCTLSPADRAVTDVPWSCLDARAPAEVGAHAATSAMVGSGMAALALRALMGLSVRPHTMVLDLEAGGQHALTVERAADCPYHAPLGAAERLPIGPNPTVGALLSALVPGEQVMAWAPILHRLECVHGHHAGAQWGRPHTPPCPACGEPLRARTTLDLSGAPADLRVSALGVAPREILPVHSARGLRLLELA